MHGLTHCNNIARILALDLGKFNSVLCRYDPATHAHQFFCASQANEIDRAPVTERRIHAEQP